MSKNDWIKHMKETTGLVPPSEGGDPGKWDLAVAEHLSSECAVCKARFKTLRAARARKAKDQAMKDCGMTKVRGAAGGVYWE